MMYVIIAPYQLLCNIIKKLNVIKNHKVTVKRNDCL